jgi:hypothetical protein
LPGVKRKRPLKSMVQHASLLNVLAVSAAAALRPQLEIRLFLIVQGGQCHDDAIWSNGPAVSTNGQFGTFGSKINVLRMYVQAQYMNSLKTERYERKLIGRY